MTELTNENFDEAVKNGVSVVKWFAHWCSPCKMMDPIFTEVENDFDNVNFLKVDVDGEMELSKKYGIRSIPITMFFKDGEMMDKIVGKTSKDIIKNKITDLLS